MKREVTGTVIRIKSATMKELMQLVHHYIFDHNIVDDISTKSVLIPHVEFGMVRVLFENKSAYFYIQSSDPHIINTYRDALKENFKCKLYIPSQTRLVDEHISYRPTMVYKFKVDIEESYLEKPFNIGTLSQPKNKTEDNQKTIF
jgi:hypothetical protein